MGLVFGCGKGHWNTYEKKKRKVKIPNKRKILCLVSALHFIIVERGNGQSHRQRERFNIKILLFNLEL